MTDRRRKIYLGTEQSALLEAFDKLRDGNTQGRNAPVMMTMPAMYAKEAIVTAIAPRKYIQILADTGDDRNEPLIQGHRDNEIIADNVLHTAGISGSPLLGIFKEYFQPLSDG